MKGILVVAAYLPQEWEVRFIDENVLPAKRSDYCWADVIIVSRTLASERVSHSRR